MPTLFLRHWINVDPGLGGLVKKNQSLFERSRMCLLLYTPKTLCPVFFFHSDDNDVALDYEFLLYNGLIHTTVNILVLHHFHCLSDKMQSCCKMWANKSWQSHKKQEHKKKCIPYEYRKIVTINGTTLTFFLSSKTVISAQIGNIWLPTKPK